jgi:hypothetical protein
MKISIFLKERRTPKIRAAFLSGGVTSFFDFFSLHCNACQILFLKGANDDNVTHRVEN